MQDLVKHAPLPAVPDQAAQEEAALAIQRLAKALASFVILFGIMLIPGCIERNIDAIARIASTVPPEAVYFPIQFPQPEGPPQPHVDAF